MKVAGPVYEILPGHLADYDGTERDLRIDHAMRAALSLEPGANLFVTGFRSSSGPFADGSGSDRGATDEGGTGVKPWVTILATPFSPSAWRKLVRVSIRLQPDSGTLHKALKGLRGIGLAVVDVQTIQPPPVRMAAFNIHAHYAGRFSVVDTGSGNGAFPACSVVAELPADEQIGAEIAAALAQRETLAEEPELKKILTFLEHVSRRFSGKQGAQAEPPGQSSVIPFAELQAAARAGLRAVTELSDSGKLNRLPLFLARTLVLGALAVFRIADLTTLAGRIGDLLTRLINHCAADQTPDSTFDPAETGQQHAVVEHFVPLTQLAAMTSTGAYDTKRLWLDGTFRTIVDVNPRRTDGELSLVSARLDGVIWPFGDRRRDTARDMERDRFVVVAEADAAHQVLLWHVFSLRRSAVLRARLRFNRNLLMHEPIEQLTERLSNTGANILQLQTTPRLRGGTFGVNVTVAVRIADHWSPDTDNALVKVAEALLPFSEPEPGKGEAGKGDAGKGDAGKGDAGTGEAGKGEAGKGEAGKGEAGKGEASEGDAEGKRQQGVGKNPLVERAMEAIRRDGADPEAVHEFVRDAITGVDSQSQISVELCSPGGEVDELDCWVRPAVDERVHKERLKLYAANPFEFTRPARISVSSSDAGQEAPKSPDLRRSRYDTAYSREELVELIVHGVTAPTPRAFAVVGAHRSGKSSLLRAIAEQAAASRSTGKREKHGTRTLVVGPLSGRAVTLAEISRQIIAVTADGLGRRGTKSSSPKAWVTQVLEAIVSTTIAFGRNVGGAMATLLAYYTAVELLPGAVGAVSVTAAGAPVVKAIAESTLTRPDGGALAPNEQSLVKAAADRVSDIDSSLRAQFEVEVARRVLARHNTRVVVIVDELLEPAGIDESLTAWPVIRSLAEADAVRHADANELEALNPGSADRVPGLRGLIDEFTKAFEMQTQDFWNKLGRSSVTCEHPLGWVISMSRGAAEPGMYSPLSNVFDEVRVDCLRYDEAWRLVGRLKEPRSHGQGKDKDSHVGMHLALAPDAQHYVVWVCGQLPYLTQVVCHRLYQAATTWSDPVITVRDVVHLLEREILIDLSEYFEHQLAHMSRLSRMDDLEALLTEAALGAIQRTRSRRADVASDAAIAALREVADRSLPGERRPEVSQPDGATNRAWRASLRAAREDDFRIEMAAPARRALKLAGLSGPSVDVPMAPLFAIWLADRARHGDLGRARRVRAQG